MKFAEDQGAAILMQNSQAEYMDWMDQLEAAQLPDQEHRRLAGAEPLVVRAI